VRQQSGDFPYFHIRAEKSANRIASRTVLISIGPADGGIR
jgi:hypothetical protein